MPYTHNQILLFSRGSKDVLVDALESADASCVYATTCKIFNTYNTILGAAIVCKHLNNDNTRRYINAESLNILMNHGATLQGESLVVMKKICRIMYKKVNMPGLSTRYTPAEWPEYKATLTRAIKTFVPTRVTPEDVSEITSGCNNIKSQYYLLKYLFEHPNVRKVGFDTSMEEFTTDDIITGKVKSCLSFLSNGKCNGSAFYMSYSVVRKYIHETVPMHDRNIIYGNFIRKLAYVDKYHRVDSINSFYPDYIRDCVEYGVLQYQHINTLCGLRDNEFIEIVKFILMRCRDIPTSPIEYIEDDDVWCKVIKRIFKMQYKSESPKVRAKITRDKLQVIGALSYLGYGIDCSQFRKIKVSRRFKETHVYNMADYVLLKCADADMINYALEKIKPDTYLALLDKITTFHCVHKHVRNLLNVIDKITHYTDQIFTSIVNVMIESISRTTVLTMHFYSNDDSYLDSSTYVALDSVDLIISVFEKNIDKYHELVDMMYDTLFNKSINDRRKNIPITHLGEKVKVFINRLHALRKK